MRNAIVLSAGKGTRMHSELPKGAFIVIDKPMVAHAVDMLKKSSIDNIVVVVGHLKEVIYDLLKDEGVEFATQEIQNGTASAAMTAKELLEDKEGDTLIIPADMPLISSELVEELYKVHTERKNDLTVLSAFLDNPFAYGRIVRDKNGKFLKITEEVDANEEEKKIKEINSGLILCNNSLLFKELSKIKNNNKKGEYYLTDIVEIMIKDSYKVDAYPTKDSVDIIGVNDRYSLSVAEKTLSDRIKKNLMLNGTTIRFPETVMIGEDVAIGSDVTIEPNTIILVKP